MTDDNRRQRLISFRISPEEMARLKQAAQADGRSVSNFVRHRLFLTEMDPGPAEVPEIRPDGGKSPRIAQKAPKSEITAGNAEIGPENPKTASAPPDPSIEAPDEIFSLGPNATPRDVQRAKDNILRGINRKPR